MKRTINLIPEEYYLRRGLRLRLMAWGAVFAVAVPALFGLFLWERAHCRELERRLAEHQAYQARLGEVAGRLEGLRHARDGLQARQGVVRSLLGRQTNTLLLAGLDQAMEPGVWLTLLEVDRSAGILGALAGRQGGREAAAFKMRGYAPSHAALARLLPRLAQSGLLVRPRLIYSKAVSVGERSAVEFEVEAELRCT